ncbi:hypothetical protein N7527_011018 [Penicillium freii]|nr:hypothetical protein N7527_011018 [Penicillium freii]
MTPVGPKPPVRSPEEDKYKWGVGEEADLITFLPIFDTIDTQWTFVDTLWGLSGDVLRRTSPVAIGRVSKKITPTLALWHGLKAVYVPHPVYVDGKWSSKELGRILNPGQPEKINGGDDSVWNWNHRLRKTLIGDGWVTGLILTNLLMEAITKILKVGIGKLAVMFFQ